MSLTTLKDILVSGRAKVATVAISRSASATFKEHLTNTPFETSPLAGIDGFELVARNEEQTQGFGITGAREWQAEMVLKLGHAPYEADDAREEWRVEDMERLADILEAHTWPTGTMLVLQRSVSVNKTDPNWWITELVFFVVWLGALRTS